MTAAASLPLAPMAPGAMPARVVVAYSGGMDSSVLLHALLHARRDAPAAWPAPVHALHVHHGLQPDADAWAEHCHATCRRWGVPLRVQRVAVDAGGGHGREGAARLARHAALAAALAPGDVVALAHHRDDQAETLLLRALRASGVDGLAGMRGWRPCGAGAMWRPLLALPRAALRAYAEAHELDWIDDPSNDDPSLDRNHLRLHVLPRVRDRWPQADAALARSAALAAEAATLLADGDAVALATCRVAGDAALSLAALQALPAARRARVLRTWIASRALPPLPARGVACVEAAMQRGLGDGIAFHWSGATLRCWRGGLHVHGPEPTLPDGFDAPWDAHDPPVLPSGDCLRLAPCAPGNDAPVALDGALQAAFGPLRVRARRGGERFRQPGRAHSQALKALLQAHAMPPWQRARIPLLTIAGSDRVLAAGDLLVDAGFAAWLQARGLRVHWQRREVP